MWRVVDSEAQLRLERRGKHGVGEGVLQHLLGKELAARGLFDAAACLQKHTHTHTHKKTKGEDTHRRMIK
jgi:hypothetical protein